MFSLLQEPNSGSLMRPSGLMVAVRLLNSKGSTYRIDASVNYGDELKYSLLRNVLKFCLK